jgi:hypothetical protein
MIELSHAVEGAFTIVKLGREIGAMLKSGDDQDKALHEIMAQLRQAASSKCKYCGDELIEMRKHLYQWGMNESKSISELLGDASWYNWLTRSRLRGMHSTFAGMHQSLMSMIDQITAVLLCSHKTQKLSKELQATAQTKQDLDRFMSEYETQPIGKVLDTLIMLAHQQAEKLAMS